MPRSERDEVISKLVCLPYSQRPRMPSSRIHVHFFSAQTALVFSAMINDLVMDATLQAHYEVQKLNALCDICHTRYFYFNEVMCFAQYHSDANGLIHPDKAVAQVRCDLWITRFTYEPSHSHSAHASSSTGPTNSASPRPPSPIIEGKQSTPTGSASGASTGPTNGKPDGTIYFECLGCKRQVSMIPRGCQLLYPPNAPEKFG